MIFTIKIAGYLYSRLRCTNKLESLIKLQQFYESSTVTDFSQSLISYRTTSLHSCNNPCISSRSITCFGELGNLCCCMYCMLHGGDAWATVCRTGERCRPTSFESSHFSLEILCARPICRRRRRISFGACIQRINLITGAFVAEYWALREAFFEAIAFLVQFTQCVEKRLASHMS